jgi:hypothetical protein
MGPFESAFVGSLSEVLAVRCSPPDRLVLSENENGGRNNNPAAFIYRPLFPLGQPAARNPLNPSHGLPPPGAQRCTNHTRNDFPQQAGTLVSPLNYVVRTKFICRSTFKKVGHSMFVI